MARATVKSQSWHEALKQLRVCEMMSVTSVGNEDMKRPMVWAVTWSQVGVLGLCCPGVYTNLIGLHCLLGSWLYPGLGCCQ